MITSFDVYLILQLDAINGVFLTISLIGMILSYVSFLFFYEKSRNDVKRKFNKLFLCFFVLFVLTAFVPSTKTAAAMFLIPKLTGDEIVNPMSNELKEFYNLTKDAIKKIAEE